MAPSLQDWLPEDHLARFLAEVVGELNLEPILTVYPRKDHRGAEGYHPEMLTLLLLYGYATGLTSSRRIEKATYDNVAYRYLAADQHPDHDTIAAFRQQHLDALAQLFVQALQLCSRAGLVKLGNVAIDGTKLKANASFHRGKTHARMSEEERKLTELVNRWMEEAQQTDAAEDARFGKGKPSASACNRQAILRNRNCRWELAGSLPKTLRCSSRNAGTFIAARAAIRSWSVFFMRQPHSHEGSPGAGYQARC